jgi:hypothetical protein
MPFTENCDLYGAVLDAGVNRAISLIMAERPSLFNYATSDIVANPELWCAKVTHTVDVTNHANPLFTTVGPLPLLGSDDPTVSIGFCAQVTSVQVDFSPENIITIPPGLQNGLPAQQLALRLQICGAIECPTPDEVGQVPAGGQFSDQGLKGSQSITLRGRLNCFCLEVVAIGTVVRLSVAGVPSLLAQVTEVDVVGLEPEGLEANLACYVKTTVNVVLREKLTIAIKTLMLSFPLFNIATVTLEPTPDPPIANNPAIDDNQLKAFVTIT